AQFIKEDYGTFPGKGEQWHYKRKQRYQRTKPIWHVHGKIQVRGSAYHVFTWVNGNITLPYGSS
ncbi:hypothetical protein, partial [Pseudoalteromonas sp.]|uniref:hypothetical protein n=1 Tax=Pseudoalteromonas sp. TaxID=53249 RepID=UPI002627ECF5